MNKRAKTRKSKTSVPLKAQRTMSKRRQTPKRAVAESGQQKASNPSAEPTSQTPAGHVPPVPAETLTEQASRLGMLDALDAEPANIFYPGGSNT